MAIVTRRYKMVGPTNTNLTKYVGSSAVQNALFSGAVIDIDINNATADATTTLDQYMDSIGFTFDSVATAPSLVGSLGAFTKQQYTVPSVLTYGANIAVDANLSNIYTVTLTGVTAQLDNPSNLVAGMSLQFLIKQDATGLRALTFGTAYTFGTAGAPTIATSTANQTDVISCVAVSSTVLICTTIRGF